MKKGKHRHRHKIRKKVNNRRNTICHIKIALPKILDFLTSHNETSTFFTTLHNAILGGWRNKITLNFSLLEFVSPSAALVLASELDFWRNARHAKIRMISEQWNEQPKLMLGELGLFDLLRVINPPPTISLVTSERLTIKFKTGAESPGEIPNNDQAINLEDELVNVAGEFPGKEDLFSGITEAMNNVRSHAYPDRKKNAKKISHYIYNRWWMTGSFDIKTRNLTIIFYDQGVGIPNTIEKQTGRSFLAGLITKFSTIDTDAFRIRAAVEYGRTSTAQKERGKGLMDIRRVADTAGDAKLFIVSGRGLYSYLPNIEENDINKEGRLQGTLIQWEISLPMPQGD
ncbi:MAG: hypothetical protein HQL07_10365 [Nitrospirae bacterium]|nr:hypothetical protein [Magnetococcales bacterium]